MPNVPYKPIVRQRSSSTPIVSRVSSEPHIPATIVSSRVRTPATVFNSSSIGLSNYEVSGAASTTLTLASSQLSSNSAVQLTGSAPLTSFPSPFTLVAGTSGIVMVSASLSPNSAIPSGVLIGNMSATFLYGANSTPTLGPLSPGLTYTQPTVSVTLTVANISGSSVSGFSFVVVAQAILLGAVISGG